MKISTLPKSLTLILLFFIGCLNAQSNVIKPKKGYSPLIGTTVSMMENLKQKVANSVAHLNQEETDFLLDENANRIGALILHLAAVEKYYQLYTFENRGFNKAEKKKWNLAFDLNDKSRKLLVDKPISYYLEIWDEVRKESLKLLKKKNDKWYNSKLGIKGINMNNHWAWFHVMEHQANHLGQIRLITKRMP